MNDKSSHCLSHTDITGQLFSGRIMEFFPQIMNITIFHYFSLSPPVASLHSVTLSLAMTDSSNFTMNVVPYERKKDYL